MNEKQAITDMTQGSPMRLILRFAVPMFIGNIFQQVYHLVDTMVAGYCLGDQAIAAIGATSSLYALILEFALGLNGGFAIIITQAFGARNEDRIRKSVAGAILLNGCIGLLLTAVVLALLNPLMRLLNVPAGIFDHAHSYIAIICGGLLATISYNMFAGIMRSFGNSKTPLLFLIIFSVLNVLLDLLMVAVFKMGVAGAAWATVLSQAVCAVCCGCYVFRKYRQWMPGKADIRPGRVPLGDLLSSGLAMAGMYSVYSVGSVIFQGAANQLGQAYITSHTAARKVLDMLKQPQATLAQANATFTAQNKGAGQTERIRNALRNVLQIEVIWGIIAAAVIWLFGGRIIQAITGTQDVFILSQAELSLRCHFTALPFLGLVLARRTAMQSLGQKAAPVMTSALELVLKIVSAFLVIPAVGFPGVCLTEPVCWVLMSLFLYVIYIRSTTPKYLSAPGGFHV